jgi:hypothetical protein
MIYWAGASSLSYIFTFTYLNHHYVTAAVKTWSTDFSAENPVCASWVCSAPAPCIAPQQKTARASSFSCVFACIGGVSYHYQNQASRPFRGVLREAKQTQCKGKRIGQIACIQCCRSATNLDRLSTSTHRVSTQLTRIRWRTCAPCYVILSGWISMDKCLFSSKKFLKKCYSSHHLESLDACMEH